MGFKPVAANPAFKERGDSSLLTGKKEKRKASPSRGCLPPDLSHNETRPSVRLSAFSLPPFFGGRDPDSSAVGKFSMIATFYFSIIVQMLINCKRRRKNDTLLFSNSLTLI